METASRSQLTEAAKALEEVMREDERVVVLTADLAGSCKISGLREKYPARFFNVGIAEQNMVAMAAGLAHEGYKPFVFTFSVFASLRACEQVRTDIFYNGMNVKVVGTHGGMSACQAGSTHFSLEDIGVIRSMPGSRIIVPSDGISAGKYMRMLAETETPAYIRLDRNPIPDIYKTFDELEIGRGNILAEGKNIAVIAIGEAVSEALQAGKAIEKSSGIQITVVDMPTIKPLDVSLIKRLAQTHSNIITVEEHNIYGGLGSAVGQAVENMGCP